MNGERLRECNVVVATAVGPSARVEVHRHRAEHEIILQVVAIDVVAHRARCADHRDPLRRQARADSPQAELRRGVDDRAAIQSLATAREERHVDVAALVGVEQIGEENLVTRCRAIRHCVIAAIRPTARREIQREIESQNLFAIGTQICRDHLGKFRVHRDHVHIELELRRVGGRQRFAQGVDDERNLSG